MKRALRYGIAAFVFALPFGTKKFVTALIPQLFEYSREFSSFFVYATDVLAAILLVALALYLGRRSRPVPLAPWLTAFAALALASTFFALNAPYAAYVAASFVVALFAAAFIAVALREGIVEVRALFAAFAASATFQAIIAIVQFYYQKSIGLWFLGEVLITQTTAGIARVDIGGVKFLRAYGTLPHANILAGFLVMGLIACAYLYLSAPRGHAVRHGAVAVSTFLILVALVLTFSRSGWIVAGVSVLVTLAYAFWNGELRRRAGWFLGVVLVSSAAIALSLGWAVSARAGFAKGEFSIDHRVFYNEMGLMLVREHPQGVGIGNEVLQAAEEGLFQGKGLTQPWLWQPVHNIYILIADELGGAGLLLFLAILFLVMRRTRFSSAPDVFALFMLASLLLFGAVDHFPWDLHAGRLMFWVAFGILMGSEMETKPL